MSIEIKKMESDEEIKGKGYVHWKSWQDAYKGIVDQSYLDSLTLEKCVDIAFKWPDNLMVAKDGDRVVGFVGYGKYHDQELPEAGEIFAIYILEEYYGTGVGKALMQAGLDELDYPAVALWVLKDNKRAIRFYEKCGFRLDGREKEIQLGSPIVEVRMIRTGSDY